VIDEIAIVGGGPAGSTAAWSLAKAGRAVRLFERDAEPRHKICGEFVSIEAQAVLRDMGIDPAALGAPPITRLWLVHDRRVAEIALPFRAVGLTRRAMDTAMLAAAEAAGARVERGVGIREIAGMRLQTADEEIDAQQLILASGKHDVRGARRVSRGTVDHLVGFKSYFELAEPQRAALADQIEVLLFDGGYAGLQLVEGGLANLCLLVTRDRFERAGSWPRLLEMLCNECGHLTDRLTGAQERLERPLTIAGVPYGFRYRPKPDDPPRLYRVGDQCAVIPSFSGCGMAIAVHSGRAAAQAILAGEDARIYHARQRAAFGHQIRVAGAVYHLGEPAWLQPAIVEAMRRWPGLAARLAAWTRVPT
jgi:menaquinone-9 beta-reductase